MPQTVGDLGEFGLVRAVTERLASQVDVLLGPGDDAAVLAAPDGRVVVSTDVLVEGRHFRRDWCSATDVGHRAAAANLADIAAMGAVPTGLLVGLSVPLGLEASWALELADGLREECDRVGVSVVGGDLTAGEAVVVSVTALGSLAGRPPVTRSGARTGDVVAVAGRLGWAAAGLAVLSRGFRSPRVLVEAYRRPEVPYALGPEAAVLGAHAMIDVSDGLVGDLRHVATASGVRIEIHPASLVVPEEFDAPARAIGVDPMQWVLSGGDDHALAACFGPEVVLPEEWHAVGHVVAGEGVVVGAEPYEEGGFDHFR